ncbi:MAG: exodeoxyribonuclease VII small subunit [Clostridia bacterium]|nr:exodeoxyribonuclease VII small subunit [Clostridia bacterium]
MPFEAAIARLEVIVKAMEGASLSLDESLALYEEGVALTRRLNRELGEAEQRVQILQRTADGEIKPAPFTSTED